MPIYGVIGRSGVINCPVSKKKPEYILMKCMPEYHTDIAMSNGTWCCPENAGTMEECRRAWFLKVKEKCQELKTGCVIVDTTKGTKTFQSRDCDIINIQSSLREFDESAPVPLELSFYTQKNESPRPLLSRDDFVKIGLKITKLHRLCDNRQEDIRALINNTSLTTPKEVEKVYKENINTGWPTVPYNL